MHSRKPREDCRKRGRTDVDGFVIKGLLNGSVAYLGHDKAWYNHECPEIAYVFTAEMVEAGGAWVQNVTGLIPAHYNHEEDSTKVTGPEVSHAEYSAGLAALAQAHV